MKHELRPNGDCSCGAWSVKGLPDPQNPRTIGDAHTTHQAIARHDERLANRPSVNWLAAAIDEIHQYWQDTAKTEGCVSGIPQARASISKTISTVLLVGYRDHGHRLEFSDPGRNMLDGGLALHEWGGWCECGQALGRDLMTGVMHKYLAHINDVGLAEALDVKRGLELS